MTQTIAALLPPVVIAGLFIALVRTALRATDWSEKSPPKGSEQALPAEEPIAETPEDKAG